MSFKCQKFTESISGMQRLCEHVDPINYYRNDVLVRVNTSRELPKLVQAKQKFYNTNFKRNKFTKCISNVFDLLFFSYLLGIK